jgi:hypothetical protein
MTEAASAGQQVPRSMAIVFDAHDPKATPLAGMPSIALWEEFDRTGVAQLARLTPRSGIWELAPEPGPHTRLVRVGRNWNR